MEAESKIIDKDKKNEEAKKIVWTYCDRCGDNWSLKMIMKNGTCPRCGRKVKLQRVVF